MPGAMRQHPPALAIGGPDSMTSNRRIPAAGDPFTAKAPDERPHERQGEPPHACMGGYVYMGYVVEGEDGEPVEVVEAVRCKRCEAKRRTKPGRERDGR